MAGWVVTWLYRAIKQLVTLDVTYLLWLDQNGLSPQSPITDGVFRVLTNDEIAHLSCSRTLGISPQLVSDFSRYGYCAVGYFCDGEAIAISFFASEYVIPRHNSGGADFKGIGLRFPSNVRYLFKAFVQPSYRGKQINASIINFALDHFSATQDVTAIVTTTEISNSAFLKSVYRLGFQSRGIAVEWRFLNRQYYVLPIPIDAYTGQPTRNIKDRSQIVAMFTETKGDSP